MVPRPTLKLRFKTFSKFLTKNQSVRLARRYLWRWYHEHETPKIDNDSVNSANGNKGPDIPGVVVVTGTKNTPSGLSVPCSGSKSTKWRPERNCKEWQSHVEEEALEQLRMKAWQTSKAGGTRKTFRKQKINLDVQQKSGIRFRTMKITQNVFHQRNSEQFLYLFFKLFLHQQELEIRVRSETIVRTERRQSIRLPGCLGEQ